MPTTSDYEDVGKLITEIVSSVDYDHSKSEGPKGAKGEGGTRQYRIMPKDVSKKRTVDDIVRLFETKALQDFKFNRISVNSSKFPSVSFTYKDVNADVVIAGGSNKGESFEKMFVTMLAAAAGGMFSADSYGQLLNQLEQENRAFQKDKVVEVVPRRGSTKKENVPIERLGSVIGDVVVKDENRNEWYLSVKDINGDTFSSYSGAASLFNSRGDLQSDSKGAQFLAAFDVNLDEVQRGFDERSNRIVAREKIRNYRPSESLDTIFSRAWGMNYFYVRRQSSGWKTFWIDKGMLDRLTSNIRVTRIEYPNKKSKQVTIFCENSTAKYKVEVRNSKGGEYPNDVKFKVLSMRVY